MGVDLQAIQPSGAEVPNSSAELLPLIYTELRQLAAHKLSHERPGQTLQATALVHEAWLRLDHTGNHRWNGRARLWGAHNEGRLADELRCQITGRSGP